MTLNEQKQAAKRFADDWQGRGYEKGETAAFWTALLRGVYGMAEPERHIQFEVPVKLPGTGFIDALIPETRVLIEQKNLNIDLDKPQKQSDGTC